MSDEGVSFRLRGNVGGIPRAFELVPGANRVGSVGTSAVVLPVRGVSRQHAVLELSADALAVEDLGSRNGTFVNDVRVSKGRLLPGDVVRFGPVSLLVEAVAAADTHLAFEVTRPPGFVGLSPAETTSVEDAARGEAVPAVLGLLEAVLAAHQGGGGASALDLLARGVRGRGAILFEWRRGAEPVTLGIAGSADERLEAALGSLVREEGERALREGGVTSARRTDGITIRVALRATSTEEGLGIAVWDDAGAADVDALLRVLVYVLEPLGGVGRPRPAAPAGAAKPAELVFPDGYLAGASAVMASLYEQMRPLVQGDLPVLLEGETGVGKEYVARILHISSARRRGPFVAINCAAIPGEMLEAELFGIGKGVATGVLERPGRFQLAQSGTILLDEIGEMPVALQAKLLRALQEKEVQPVGGAPVPVDIRVVSATNTDLLRRVEEGRFRRDLYYRVAGYVLRVPSLRERPEDIPVLVQGFVRAFAAETGKTVRGVTVKALRLLSVHSWPGNVRELEHEVRRLVYLCPEGEAIDSPMVSPHVLSGSVGLAPPLGDAAPAGASQPRTAGAGLDLEGEVNQLQARLIREALARAGGNRTKAAKLLGVSRNGLAIKMGRLGIEE